MKKYKPGQKINMLTLVKPVRKMERSRRWVWLFRCDCGNMKEALLSNVVHGKTKSCGCIRWKNHAEKISSYVEQIETDYAEQIDSDYVEKIESGELDDYTKTLPD